MSHIIFFRAPLVCPTTGSIVDGERPNVFTSSLNPDPMDIDVERGEVIAIALEDFADGYFTLRPPADDVRALELWECSACNQDHWVVLAFERVDDEHYRFVAADRAELSDAVLGSVHYVSRWMETWLPGLAEDERERLLAALAPMFPPATLAKLSAREN